MSITGLYIKYPFSRNWHFIKKKKKKKNNNNNKNKKNIH